MQTEYRDEPGSVITADFYHASALLPLTDADIVQRLTSHLAACEPGFKGGWGQGGLLWMERLTLVGRGGCR